jgi:hypothetical protein
LEDCQIFKSLLWFSNKNETKSSLNHIPQSYDSEKNISKTSIDSPGSLSHSLNISSFSSHYNSTSGFKGDKNIITPSVILSKTSNINNKIIKEKEYKNNNKYKWIENNGGKTKYKNNINKDNRDIYSKY